jgi:hypothetical protein
MSEEQKARDFDIYLRGLTVDVNINETSTAYHKGYMIGKLVGKITQVMLPQEVMDFNNGMGQGIDMAMISVDKVN